MLYKFSITSEMNSLIDKGFHKNPQIQTSPCENHLTELLIAVLFYSMLKGLVLSDGDQ